VPPPFSSWSISIIWTHLPKWVVWVEVTWHLAFDAKDHYLWPIPKLDHLGFHHTLCDHNQLRHSYRLLITSHGTSIEIPIIFLVFQSKPLDNSVVTFEGIPQMGWMQNKRLVPSLLMVHHPTTIITPITTYCFTTKIVVVVLQVKANVWTIITSIIIT